MTFDRIRPTRLLLGAAALGVAVLLAAPAFACTSTNPLTVEPGSGAAGTAVDLSGRWFEADGTPVEIRFVEGQAETGPVVATVVPDERGQFVTSVAVPDVEPGYYFFVARQERSSAESRQAQPGRATFEVTAPVQEQPAAQEQPPAEEPAPQPQPAAQEEPAGQEAPAPAPASEPTPAAAPAAATAPAPSDQPAAPATESAPAAATAPQAQAPAPAAPAPEEVAAPSIATAEADPWSGFSGTSTARTPGLLDPVPGPADASTPSSTGLALLVYGTVTLLAGVGVAGLRRARARATR